MSSPEWTIDSTGWEHLDFSGWDDYVLKWPDDLPEDAEAWVNAFDLHPFPENKLHKLTPNVSYSVQRVYDRLVEIQAINCTKEFFLKMLDAEKNYHVQGEYMYRTMTLVEELQEAIRTGYAPASGPK